MPVAGKKIMEISSFPFVQNKIRHQHHNNLFFCFSFFWGTKPRFFWSQMNVILKMVRWKVIHT
jgi:hypothetical protein